MFATPLSSERGYTPRQISMEDGTKLARRILELYKIITDEAIIAARPDIVLSIQRSKDTLDAETVFAHPAFALTPVTANRGLRLYGGFISSRLRTAYCRRVRDRT
jgi:ABC-type hemin transport system substrate-binding protein